MSSESDTEQAIHSLIQTMRPSLPTNLTSHRNILEQTDNLFESMGDIYGGGSLGGGPRFSPEKTLISVVELIKEEEEGVTERKSNIIRI
jgi:hypothetical protein